MNEFPKYVCFFLCLLLSLSSAAQNITKGRTWLKDNFCNGKYVLSQDMLDVESLTYVIKYPFDLNGKTLVVPEGCNLEFKKKGSISNGNIVFNGTWLKNERFYNIKHATGLLLNKVFDAFRFGFSDDTEMFRFLLTQAKNGFVLRLEPRLYQINTIKGTSLVKYDSAFARFSGICGFSIIGNNSIIEDSASKSQIGKNLYSVLQFDSCKDVTIKGVSYIWKEEAVLHPKVEGIVFIRTFNECRAFNVDIMVKNAGRGIYSGRWNDKGNPGRGICDSELKINAVRVGYPIAIEKGDKLDIVNRFAYAHRGTYLAGVTNSKVYVEGKEAYSTKVNLLLTDTSDSAGCYFCDGIKATVVDLGTKELASGVVMAECNTYPQSYEQFKGRKPYNVKSIEIEVYTPKGASSSYEGFLYSDMAKIGDSMNISIRGKMADEGGNSRLARLRDVPAGVISFKSMHSHRNIIILHSDIPNGGNILFEDCSNIIFSLPSQKRKTTGSITFNGCTFKKYTKSDQIGSGIFPSVFIHK